MAPKVKMYPEIKSRILPGYAYPKNYPGTLLGPANAPMRNDKLPQSMLDTAVTIQSGKRTGVAKAPSFLGAMKNGPQFSNGYNDGMAYMPVTVEDKTRWLIKQVSGGKGYTIELEKPVDGYKYLSAPDVCFTPLNNAEAAKQDQPWPVPRKDAQGNVIPQKYAIQGPEWYPKIGKIRSQLNPNDATGLESGMFGTPGWWPICTLAKKPSEYTTWRIQKDGDSYYLSTDSRPNTCGTRLGTFPWNPKANAPAWYKLAYQDYMRLLPMTYAAEPWKISIQGSMGKCEDLKKHEGKTFLCVAPPAWDGGFKVVNGVRKEYARNENGKKNSIDAWTKEGKVMARVGKCAQYRNCAKMKESPTAAPSTAAPSRIPQPTYRPFRMMNVPVSGDVTTAVSAGNTDLELNIANESNNANNIANAGGGGSGGGGDATTAMLLASLMAQQAEAAPPGVVEANPPVFPYPNPFAQPYYATNPPSQIPTQPPATPTVDPTEALLRQLMTAAPAAQPTAPWYKNPVVLIGGAVALAVLLGAVWWFFLRKKQPASNASTSSGSFTPTPVAVAPMRPVNATGNIVRGQPGIRLGEAAY